MHAERCPRVGREQALLRSVLGSHVADFPFFSPIRETSRPRLASTILALARPRDVLVQSSATRDLALALGHRPRPLGARVATPFMGKLTCRQRSGSTTHVGARVSSYAWLGVVLAVRAGRIGHRGVAPTSLHGTLGDLWPVATMATMATPAGQPQKKSLPDNRWLVITPSTPFFIFFKFQLGVAKVAMVAMTREPTQRPCRPAARARGRPRRRCGERCARLAQPARVAAALEHGSERPRPGVIAPEGASFAAFYPSEADEAWTEKC